VVPVWGEWYFRRGSGVSIANFANFSLAASEEFLPGAGVDVFLYSHQRAERSHLAPGHLEEWVADWAVLPNEDIIVGDRIPPNSAERFRAAGTSPDPLEAARVVSAHAAQIPGPKLVLFWTSGTELKELLREIASTEDSDIFWQFFGDHDDFGPYDPFAKRKDRRGGLLSNVWCYLMAEPIRFNALLSGFLHWMDKRPALR
jgi:hypothetical protein